MSKLFVDEIVHQSSQGSGTITLGASGETVALASGVTSGAGMGKVLQVISAGYTTVSAFSGSTTTYRDSGLTASITPSSTSNKILITGHISGGFDNADQGYGINYKLVRNSTDLGLGSQSGTTPGMGSITTGSNDDDYATAPFVYLDTPSSTSATTYKIQVLGRDGKAFVINAGGDYADDSSTAARLSGTSYITLMEIAG